MRELAQLVPYPGNARKHSDAQVAQIAASIREFGWTRPVLIDEDNSILVGHGAVLGGLKLGHTHAPCIVIDGLTKAQRRLYRITDNKLALNSEWDYALLVPELEELDGEIELTLSGFSQEELEKLSQFDPEAGTPTTGTSAQYQVLIECASEVEQAAMLQRLKDHGIEGRALTR